MDPEPLWLTQDAFDRLQAEMDDRTGPLRAKITSRIEAAREEGDLKENGGYHAAKEEQGKNEARIRQLRQMLENAEVGAPIHDGTVQAKVPPGRRTRANSAMALTSCWMCSSTSEVTTRSKV